MYAPWQASMEFHDRENPWWKSTGLKYNNLKQQWLESNSENTGLFDTISKDYALPQYMMPAKKIANYVNSFDAFDLYRKPSDKPVGLFGDKFDYGTQAVNWASDPFQSGDIDANLFSTDTSKRQPLNTMPDSPRAIKGIMEHEMAHWYDPRLNNDPRGNKGFIGKAPWYSREQPAIDAEMSYIDNLYNSGARKGLNG
jgi:hypothetical protein